MVDCLSLQITLLWSRTVRTDRQTVNHAQICYFSVKGLKMVKMKVCILCLQSSPC